MIPHSMVPLAGGAPAQLCMSRCRGRGNCSRATLAAACARRITIGDVSTKTCEEELGLLVALA